jgi:hypothetical protein
MRSAFEALDQLRRGYIAGSDFQSAFDHQTNVTGIDISGPPSDLDCLIKRFNKDKLNGRVSMPEFCDEMAPKTPHKPY